MRGPRAGRTPSPPLVIGRITRPHGVRGEVKVQPETDFPERFATLGRVLLLRRGEIDEAVVQAARRQGAVVLLKIAGVDDLEAARALVGAAVAVPWEERVPLPEGQYYVTEVLGLVVRTEGDEILGMVREVLRTPAHDVYRVVGAGGDLLLPATRDVVRTVDLRRGEVVVRLPAGLRVP